METPAIPRTLIAIALRKRFDLERKSQALIRRIERQNQHILATTKVRDKNARQLTYVNEELRQINSAVTTANLDGYVLNADGSVSDARAEVAERYGDEQRTPTSHEWQDVRSIVRQVREAVPPGAAPRGDLRSQVRSLAEPARSD